MQYDACGVTTLQAVHMDDQTDSDVVNRPSAITASLLSQLPPPPEHDSEADIQVSYGSEDWHSALPTVCVACLVFVFFPQVFQRPLVGGLLPTCSQHTKLAGYVHTVVVVVLSG